MNSAVEKYRFDVSLEDLQTFVLVAECGSFSEAAKRLNLSQPSVSSRVRRLEEKLQTELIQRTTRKMELTETGERLHAKAAFTLQSINGLLQEFHQEALDRAKTVQVAATMMISSIVIPPLLWQYQKVRRSSQVVLKDFSPVDAARSILEQESDLGIMAYDFPNERLEFEVLKRDMYVLLAPPKHPLLSLEQVRIGDLDEHPVLCPSGHKVLRDLLTREAERENVKLTLESRGLEVTNLMTILSMVSAGLGVCVYPRSLVTKEMRAMLGVRELNNPRLIRDYGIVTLKDQPKSAATRHFIEFVRDFITSDDSNWGKPVSLSD